VNDGGQYIDQATRRMTRVQFPVRGEKECIRFRHRLQTVSVIRPTFYAVGTWWHLPLEVERLVPRLRTHGAIPPWNCDQLSNIYVFVGFYSKGTALAF